MDLKPERRGRALWLLNIIWLASTFLVLGFMLYLFWKEEQHLMQRHMQDELININMELQQFIGELRQDLRFLELPKLAPKDCNKALQNQMEHVIFNSRSIAGLMILDREGKMLCSSMEQPYELPESANSGLRLYGPIAHKQSDKPSFILQLPYQGYRVEVVLLINSLEQSLARDSDFAELIALFDTEVKRFTLQLKKTPHSNNFEELSVTEAMSLCKLPEQKRLSQYSQLSPIPHLRLILTADQAKTIQGNLGLKSLFSLMIISLSALLYALVRKQLNQYFSLQKFIANALKHNRFYPVYQPLYDQAQSRYVGAEVLLRLATAEGAVLMPDFFIDEAERSGLIVPISLQIAEQVFRDCSALVQKNSYFDLAFNLTLDHFTAADFFEKFSALCQQYRIPKRQICFELTERKLLDQSDESLKARMQALRDEGFSLAVDDFGTGHASISYLQYFPFNYLKIDKLFIHAIGTGAITETLNESIIHMANRLGLPIIAEGVETRAQLEYLKAHGVDLIQGWYFAKAMPFDELAIFLHEKQHAAS